MEFNAATNDADAEYAIGEYTVNWFVDDMASATATDTQLVTVRDSKGPVFSTLAPLEFDLHSPTSFSLDVGT